MNNSIEVALTGNNANAAPTNVKTKNMARNIDGQGHSASDASAKESSFKDSIQQAKDASNNNKSKSVNDQNGKNLPEKERVSAKTEDKNQSIQAKDADTIEKNSEATTSTETEISEELSTTEQVVESESGDAGVGFGLINPESFDISTNNPANTAVTPSLVIENSEQAAVVAQPVLTNEEVSLTDIETTNDKIKLLIPQTGQHQLTKQQQNNTTSQAPSFGSDKSVDTDAPLLNSATTSTVLSSQAMNQAINQAMSQTQQSQQAMFSQALSSQLESKTQSTSSTAVSPDTEGLPFVTNTLLNNVSPLNSTSVAQGTITETFARPGWSEGMGKQIMLMVNQNIKSAELRLNPAHLGPIEVFIDMSDDQVNVSLSSRHAVVRDAMEQALPKLREMLDENGFNLADADISQQSFAEQREQATENDTNTNFHKQEFNQTAESEAAERLVSQVPLASGVVDYYI